MYSPTVDTRVETNQMNDLQYLVENEPLVALLDHACDLSDAQFRQCAEKRPDAALMKAATRLARDKELFKMCIQIQPGFALDYAADILDDHQFVECVKKAPLTALARVYSRLCLFPELLRDCIQKEPAGALGEFSAIRPMDDWSQYSCSLRGGRLESGSEVVLNDEEFHYCITHAPGPALELESSNARLDEDQFSYCIEEAPSDAVRCCWKRLNNEQKTYCVDREPSVALWCIGAALPTEMLLKAANTKPFTVIEILNYEHEYIDFPKFRNDLIQALMPLYDRLDPRVIAEVARMTVQGI